MGSCVIGRNALCALAAAAAASLPGVSAQDLARDPRVSALSAGAQELEALTRMKRAARARDEAKHGGRPSRAFSSRKTGTSADADAGADQVDPKAAELSWFNDCMDSQDPTQEQTQFWRGTCRAAAVSPSCLAPRAECRQPHCVRRVRTPAGRDRYSGRVRRGRARRAEQDATGRAQPHDKPYPRQEAPGCIRVPYLGVPFEQRLIPPANDRVFRSWRVTDHERLPGSTVIALVRHSSRSRDA